MGVLGWRGDRVDSLPSAEAGRAAGVTARISIWDHQPGRPLLEVRCERPPEKQFGYMKCGCARIRAQYDKRHQGHRTMYRRSSKPLPDLKRPRPHIPAGELRFDAAWLRSDCTELDIRFAVFLMLEHNARTLEVGYWNGTETRPWYRHQLADRLGEPGKPLSLDQVDRLKARFRARGWEWSKQQRRDNGDGTYSSGPAKMGITKKFLQDWGVLDDREKLIRKLNLRERDAELRRQGLPRRKPRPSLEVAEQQRKWARRMSWEERELGPYRDRVRREIPTMDDWAVEREARRRYAADNPGRGPPQ